MCAASGKIILTLAFHTFLYHLPKYNKRVHLDNFSLGDTFAGPLIFCVFSSKIGEIRYIFRSRFALIETYEATQRPRGALYIISCTQEGFVLDVYFIYSSSNCFLLKTSHKTSFSRHISGFTFEIYTNSFTQLFKVTSKLPLVAYFYLKKHPHKIHCVDTFEGSCLMSTPTVLVKLSIKLNGKVRWSHSII